MIKDTYKLGKGIVKLGLIGLGIASKSATRYAKVQTVIHTLEDELRINEVQEMYELLEDIQGMDIPESAKETYTAAVETKITELLAGKKDS